MLEPIVLEFQAKGVDSITSDVSKLVENMRLLDQYTKASNSHMNTTNNRIKAIGNSASAAARKVDGLARSLSSLPGGGAPALPMPAGGGQGSNLAAANVKIVAAKVTVSSLSGGGGSGRGSGGGSMRKPPIYNPYSNPFQAGSYQAYAFNRQRSAAYRSAYAAQNPGMNSVLSALMRSRIDSHGNLMPLVMDLAKIAGPEGLAAAEIAQAVKSLVEHAFQTNRNLASSQLMLGTTMGGASRAAGIGAATGTDFAATAVAIREALRSDPVAASIARGYGVNPYSTKFGFNNDASDMATKLLRGFLYDKNDQRAAIAAQNIPGLGDLGYARYASDDMKERLLNAQGANLTPEQRTKLADAQIAVNLAMLDFQQALLKVGVELLPAVNLAMDQFNKYMKLIAIALKLFFEDPIVKKLMDLAMKAAGIKNIHGDNEKATKDNTKALHNLDRTIREGMYGSGSAKANRALPSGLSTNAPQSRQDWDNARVNGSLVW